MVRAKFPALLLVAVLVSANTLQAQQSLGRPLHDSVAKAASQIAREPSHRSPVELHEHCWARRHPVILGALAGLGTGLVIDAKNCGASSDYTCGKLGLYLGGVGAGIGAGVGALVELATR